MDNLFIYYFLALIHILIWIFIVFAFLDKDLAIINLSYVIPFIYILQILPLHVLNTAKCHVNKNCVKDNKKIEKSIGFSYLKDLFKNSFENPLSAQGLLILGAVLSFYKLNTASHLKHANPFEQYHLLIPENSQNK